MLRRAPIEDHLLLIVGKHEDVRNSTLFIIRHLIEPTGYLKTRIEENGDVIMIYKESLCHWIESSSPQGSRRNEILENISDDLSDGSTPYDKKSSYSDAR